MSKKLYYIIGAVVVILGVIGFLVFRTPAKSANGEAITGDVTRADITKNITATGTVQQPATYNLTFKGQSLKLAKVNISVGDKVKAGDILAQADLTTLNLQLIKDQATLNSAKLKLDQSKAGTTAADSALAGAQSALAKAQDTYNTSATDVNKAALDSAKASLASAQAALQYDQQNSQAAYDTALASYNISKQNVTDATLTAPIDGTVIAQNGKAGEVVGQLPVVTLQSNSTDMQIVSSIDETDIGYVQVGQETEVTLDSYPGKKFIGKVVLISPQATTQSNVTFFNITISVTNENDMLKTGMNANLAIKVANVKNALAVSSEAIKEDNNQKYVQIIEPGTAQPQKANVDIGIDNGTLAEVKSGLQAGDKVLIGYKVTSSQKATQSSNPFGGGGKATKGLR